MAGDIKNEETKACKYERPKHEIAEIFSQYGRYFQNTIFSSYEQQKVILDICTCRTSFLGGHLYKCDQCDYERPSYNSCKNRHCPKCQGLSKARWVSARKSELLPIGYFHNVFTLPHELNPLIRSNKKKLLNILFKSVSETLLTFSKNNNDGQPGFILVLHTWDQKINEHFHLHGIIPAGFLSKDHKRWIFSNDKYLFPVQCLSAVFRGKFLDYLKQSFKKKELKLCGQSQELESENCFKKLLDTLYKKSWVVYCKRPFASPERIIEYLGNYTHRVAISNHRILSTDNGKIKFKYKYRRNGSETKETMELNAKEFMRRFLLHVLPSGFMRIRHYGFLCNRAKKKLLPICLSLLGAVPVTKEDICSEVLLKKLTGVELNICPCCKRGHMIQIKELYKQKRSLEKLFYDTS